MVKQRYKPSAYREGGGGKGTDPPWKITSGYSYLLNYWYGLARKLLLEGVRAALAVKYADD